MLATSQVKMSGSEKKRTRTKVKKHSGSIYDISYVRCVNKMFHVVVMQNNEKKKCTKKCAGRAKLFFFSLDLLIFFCRSRCRRHLALHDFIFLFEEIISILARGLLLVLANLYISNTPSVTFHEVITRTPSKTKW